MTKKYSLTTLLLVSVFVLSITVGVILNLTWVIYTKTVIARFNSDADFYTGARTITVEVGVLDVNPAERLMLIQKISPFTGERVTILAHVANEAHFFTAEPILTNGAVISYKRTQVSLQEIIPPVFGNAILKNNPDGTISLYALVVYK